VALLCFDKSVIIIRCAVGLLLQAMVRTDCSQLVMLNAADFGEANCVSKICHTNLTGLLSPDLLFVYVSNVFIFFILK